jgi:hypothetical protein
MGKIKRTNAKHLAKATEVNGRKYFKKKLIIEEEDIRELDNNRRKEIREYRKYRIPGLVFASDIDLETHEPNSKMPKELIKEVEEKKKEIINVNYDELTADDPTDVKESISKQLNLGYGIKKPKKITKKIHKNLAYLASKAFLPEDDLEIVLKVFRFNNGRS